MGTAYQMSTQILTRPDTFTYIPRGELQPLSVGLGIGNDGAAASGHPNFIYFGPELQFGHVVGDRIGKQAHTL